MRHWILPGGTVLATLWLLGLWATGGLAAVGTQRAQEVRIMDGFHTQLLKVDHVGAIDVNQAGQWNAAHISSRLHAVLIPSSNFNDIIATHTVGVGCNTCLARVSHFGAQLIEGQGTAGSAAGGVLSIQGVTGMTALQVIQSGTSWAVDSVTAPRITVAHQTSFLHLGAIKPSSNANDVLAMHIQDAGTNCTTCRARVDHYNMLVVQPHISGALRTWQVSQCGTTPALAINTNANRRDLWVMNRGNGNIYIGYGATGHVALTTANGWPIHATASQITTTARHSSALSIVYLQNYQGPLACISDLAGQTLQVMEILR